jgi:carbamate kinase
MLHHPLAKIECLKGIWNWSSGEGKAEEIVMFTSQTAVYDTRYTICMIIDGSANVIMFINGTAVGSYQLTAAEAAEVTTIRPNFSAWSASAERIIGYADNVRVVQLQP